MRIKQTNKQRDVQGEKLLSRVEKIYQDVIGRQLTCDFDERGSEEYEQGVQFFLKMLVQKLKLLLKAMTDRR